MHTRSHQTRNRNKPYISYVKNRRRIWWKEPGSRAPAPTPTPWTGKEGQCTKSWCFSVVGSKSEADRRGQPTIFKKGNKPAGLEPHTQP